MFSETVQLTTGYHMFANAARARLAAQQPDVAVACRSYAMGLDKAGQHEAGQHEARYAESRAISRRHGPPGGHFQLGGVFRLIPSAGRIMPPHQTQFLAV